MMLDIDKASFYYGLNMLRLLWKMKVITREEYNKIVQLNAEYYGVAFYIK